MSQQTTDEPEAPSEAEYEDQPCGENMCHCYCGHGHACSCDCTRCDDCRQLYENCDCED